MAEQAVREQKIYQTKDPFTKAEEKLFEGTINDKNIHEKQHDAMQVNMSYHCPACASSPAGCHTCFTAR